MAGSAYVAAWKSWGATKPSFSASFPLALSRHNATTNDTGPSVIHERALHETRNDSIVQMFSHVRVLRVSAPEDTARRTTIRSHCVRICDRRTPDVQVQYNAASAARAIVA